jgi:nitroreductase
MNRRRFLITAASGAAVVALGCHSDLQKQGQAEAVPASEDLRLTLLRSAIRAPNPHNAQPWIVELTGSNGIRLFVDRSRLLPFSDPFARQIHISQGCFLELLELAARSSGYRAVITYFPEGEYANNTIDDRPVAAIELYADPATLPDALFNEIPRRVSIKTPYQPNRILSPIDAATLETASNSEGIQWRMIQEKTQLQTLADLCKQAMAIEVASRDRDRETARWFRFSDQELAEKRDGFGLAQSGVFGARKWFAETFLLNRERAEDPHGSFTSGAITLAGEQAATASAFALLIGGKNTRLEQLRAGRAYARVHLTAARLGLAMQPLSQLPEEYAEMAGVQRHMKEILSIPKNQTVQMLFRLGYAKPTPLSRRREVRSLLRQTVAS